MWAALGWPPALTARLPSTFSSFSSLVADRELVDDVQVADHHTEFAEGDLTVEIGVRLHNGPVDELLQLHVVQVAADHHLEHLEELAVRDEAIVVDVVDLERKSELVFLTGTGAKRVEALDELQEGDVTVVVAVKHGDDTLNERVVRELGDLEELGGLERATLVAINLAEVFVEFLELALREVQVLELGLLLGQLVSHLKLSFRLFFNLNKQL